MKRAGLIFGKCESVQTSAFRKFVIGDVHKYMFDYWNERRHILGRSPHFEEIDPDRLKSILHCIFVLDYKPGHMDYRVRMAGMSLREFMKIEITGKFIRDIYERPIVDEFISCFDLARTTQKPHFFQSVRSLEANSLYRYHQMTLPLGNDQLMGTATVDCHISMIDVSLRQIIHEMDFVANYLVDLD